MQSMRRYLVQRKNEMKDLKRKAENEKRIQALDKLASAKHHLLGTKNIFGICASRKGICASRKEISSLDEIEMQLTDELLMESSGLKILKEKVQKQMRHPKKISKMEMIPESEKSKHAQGPFLV
jgi:hypothetical protein